MVRVHFRVKVRIMERVRFRVRIRVRVSVKSYTCICSQMYRYLKLALSYSGP